MDSFETSLVAAVALIQSQFNAKTVNLKNARG
jgi:hypothetical protein